MPQISSFYGLDILMNFKYHSPPHFHVWYGDLEKNTERRTINANRTFKLKKKFLEISQAEYLDNYRIKLTFNSGV